ncbi:MAG: sulfocyanin-like copper-binding protein [Chloroflexota bacterium]|nr:sulfocyanin-like copper-binding protein [Chloroflexota bacterium]
MLLSLLWRSRRLFYIGSILAVALIALACSAGGPTPQPTGASGDISAALSDWRIDMSAASAPAGRVVFNIANQSTTVHEFVVIRTDTMAAELPVKDHMLDVQAMGGPMGSAGIDMPGMSPSSNMEHPVGTVGELEDIAAGATAMLTFDNMGPGHYAIVCNIAMHYEQGMRVDFTVE